MVRKTHLALAVSCIALAVAGCSLDGKNGKDGSNGTSYSAANAADQYATATPIKHVVVIFQENVSFDHYFATYPAASNPGGEPAFTAASGTQTDIDTLAHAGLLTSNPNATNTANGAGAVLPFRLDRSQAATADQNHAYTAEEAAYHNLALDLFPKYTGTASSGGTGAFYTSGQVMGYYDGNTVTALWNYAQHYAMSDASYTTTFGPSTPGAINLISGQTNGALPGPSQFFGTDGAYDEYTDSNGNMAATLVPDGLGGYTATDDDDPIGDICSDTSYGTFAMKGKNIGDYLTANNITWGFFEAGFDVSQTNSNGSSGCGRTTTSSVTGRTKHDYIPHHQPFQYYPSTANPNHTRPSSVALIGTNNDGANHQYDMNDFFSSLQQGNLPAVSYVKAAGFQDGHAGYSSPLDEQAFVTKVINALQVSPEWKNTAVIIAYDDSDGWYDHASKIVNGSNIKVTGQNYDPLNACTSNTNVLKDWTGTSAAQGRCGYGPRVPLLVVSPYSRTNYVDHTLTDQTSILRFVEDNWLKGQRIAGSFDASAGVINNMFNFNASPNLQPYLLSGATGQPL